jgi:hypothetical protein
MLRLRRPTSWLPGGTVGRFVFEIVTITAGILIALWIDGIKEDRKDQALVRSAREQLSREIADNRRDVDGTAPARDAHMKALVEGLRAVEALRISKTPIPPLPGLGFSTPSFPRSAWDVAARTGALALMDYPHAKAYTELYDLQDLVDRAQQRYLDRLAEQSTEFFLVTQRPPGFDPRGTSLDTARAQALALLGSFENYRSLMAQLARAYETASKL